MLGFWVGCAIAVAAIVGLIGYVVAREVRLFRAASRDRPATLEGGGSHLTTRRRDG